MSEDPLERCEQCRALRWQTRQEKEAGWLPACLSLRLLSLFVGHWTIAWLAGWQCHLGPWWCWYWNCCRCPRQRQRYCCCNGCCKLIDCVSSSGLNDCLTDWLADSARTPSYLRGMMTTKSEEGDGSASGYEEDAALHRRALFICWCECGNGWLVVVSTKWICMFFKRKCLLFQFCYQH